MLSLPQEWWESKKSNKPGWILLFQDLIVWYRQAKLSSKLICLGSSDMPKCCWQMTLYKTLNFLHQYNEHTTFPLQENVMILGCSAQIKLLKALIFFLSKVRLLKWAKLKLGHYYGHYYWRIFPQLTNC